MTNFSNLRDTFLSQVPSVTDSDNFSQEVGHEVSHFDHCGQAILEDEEAEFLANPYNISGSEKSNSRLTEFK